MSGLLVPFEPLTTTTRMAWWTDIITSRSGLEQRIAVLQNPRMSWDMLLPVDLETSRRAMRNGLFRDPVSTWDLPLKTEAVAAQNDVTTNSVTVDDTYADWVAANQKIMIAGPKATDYFTATINSIGGAPGARVLTLSTGPSAGTYPKFHTEVMPVQAVYLDDGQPMSRAAPSGTTVTGEEDIGGGRWQIKAQASTFSTTLGTGGTAVATYDSEYVLGREPDHDAQDDSGGDEAFRADLTRTNYGMKIEQHWAKSFAHIVKGTRFFSDGELMRQTWKKFFGTVRGRQKRFLLPTWRHDLDLFSQPSGTSMRVKKTPGYASWFPSAAHKRFQLLKSDGTVEYAKANSFVDNGDGTETITLAASYGGGTTVKVSFLELVRLYEDEIAWEHQPGQYAEFTLRTCVVQQ